MIKKEDIAAQQPNESQEITDKRTKAVDLLYEGMIFWHDEGQKILNKIRQNLQEDGNAKEALALAKMWKGYEDRWIEIASRLAPYQSAKLSSVEVKGGTVTKYIVEVPRLTKDGREWVQQAESDMIRLPHLTAKPIVDVVQNPDDTIDEIEFEEIHNGSGVH